MTCEILKTATFVAVAVALAVTAAIVEPERRAPEIFSDQGEPFYPQFTDPQAARTIEVIDYDESTATARPLKVEFQRGRWVIVTHHNYPVDAGERLVKTAAALVDLKKDMVRSDSPQDHASYGVIDPLDQNVAGLSGRGKRVTLRGAHKEVLADFILGKPVEGKTGYRYLRVPGQKRTYAVATVADPSARFADWVNAAVLRVPAASIRRVTITSYSIDEQMGRLANLETVTLTRDGRDWKTAGVEKLNTVAVNAMAAALENLRIVDVRPKPATLARDLRSGTLQISLDAAMSLRQRGFFIAPTGRLLANDGEMIVETANGLSYVLRFGEVASGAGSLPAAGAKPADTQGADRYLFVTVSYDTARAQKYGDSGGTGERLARALSDRFADWYYVISGDDVKRLRLRRTDLMR